VLGFVAGCGRTQPSAILPLPQLGSLSKSGSLLYVLDKLEDRKLSVYTFPNGDAQKRVLMPTEGWAYICSDNAGNVYAPTTNVIFKYAHGGQRPIAYLQDKGALGGECAADPKTGNLLVTGSGGQNDCKVEIYLRAKGSPACIKAIKTIIDYPTYDNNGDLFFNYGSNGNNFLGELPSGGSKIVKIALNKEISSYYDLQWDGQDIAVQTKLSGTEDKPVVIERGPRRWHKRNGHQNSPLHRLDEPNGILFDIGQPYRCAYKLH
jgi:hypothetical protein